MDIKNRWTGKVLLTLPTFCEVDLRGAHLYQADLRGMDLRGSDLRGADLRFALFEGADLRDAKLEFASTRGKDPFKGAIRH
jgi:uncharacterized protein YjbI with pentapeptide repeats